jgi:peptide deformylase
MAVRPIAQIGEPVLRAPTRIVAPEHLASAEIQGLIDDLIDTMRDACGAGIAANQAFASERICVIEVKDNPRYPYKPPIPLTVLVNPKITLLGDEIFANYEGCLSVPNLRGVVSRHVRIRLEALDRHGNPIDRIIEGLSAGTYQHEVDHLDGLLFTDRVTDSRTLSTWNAFEQHHKAAFVQRAEALVARFGA